MIEEPPVTLAPSDSRPTETSSADETGRPVSDRAIGRRSSAGGASGAGSPPTDDRDELRRREEQLALAIGGLQGGVWELRLDPDRPEELPDECYLSASWKALLGFDPDAMPDSLAAWRERILPEDRVLFDATARAHLAGWTERHDFEYRVRHRDGRWRWLHSRGRVWRDDDGRPVRWIGIDWDVTAAKEVEEALRRSEERFSRLFHLSPAVVVVLTLPEGRILEINRSFLEELRFGRETLIGRTVAETGLFADPAQRDRVLREVVRSGEAREEVELRGGSGDRIVVRFAIERLLLDGQPCALAVGQNITERIVLEERLRRLAYHDPLTSLPNRSLAESRLAEALEHARRNGGRVGVLFIDLDRFKVINDSLGHRAGDDLLHQVVRRFEETMRANDFLARFGGDEFVLMIEGLHEPQGAESVARRLRAALAEPFEVDGTRIHQKASIGVVSSSGGGESAEELLRYADVAMYRAKARGGDSLEVFDGEVEPPEIHRLQLENDLRLAVERDELVLHYQPIVELARRRIQGVEALLRWRHPRRGLMMPADFIPLAEESGLIVPIGEWVLRRACREVSGWRLDGRVRDDFWVSVNLSARQIESRRFASVVQRVLEETGLPPEGLLLELTENLLLEASERARELRALGVRLAIDDFGTGYASLAYLQRMIVDVLKIDRSFTRESLDRDAGKNPAAGLSLVRTIVYLAESLGLTVVAEGIETVEQENLLREIGCDFGQGYLFARPQPAAELFEQEIKALPKT